MTHIPGLSMNTSGLLWNLNIDLLLSFGVNDSSMAFHVSNPNNYNDLILANACYLLGCPWYVSLKYRYHGRAIHTAHSSSSQTSWSSDWAKTSYPGPKNLPLEHVPRGCWQVMSLCGALSENGRHFGKIIACHRVQKYFLITKCLGAIFYGGGF